MTYSVLYGDGKGVATAISGYLLVQPFRFEQGALLLQPDGARLLVQIHLSRSENVTYPSPTATLPLSGTFDIRDSIGNTPVTVTGFRAEAIYSSQSFDLATTTWVLAGAPGATIAVKPPPHRSTPTDDDANHHPWRGTFDAGDGHQLKLSYLDYTYSVAAGRRGISQLFAVGPANADGVGTVFSFVSGAAQRQPLSTATIADPHRNTTMTVFGASDESLAQMRTANGMVFALNGCFKHATPSSLRRVLHAATNPLGQTVAHPLWQTDPFEHIAQTIARSEERMRGNEEFEVTGSEIEGITLWGMNALKGSVAPALL